jgi:type IV pilus assembly protein PilC
MQNENGEMPAFQFEAVDKRGQAVSGVEAAKDISELAGRLRRSGYTIIDISEERNLRKSLMSRLGFGRRVPLFSIVVMMRQFATLLRASIPIGLALDALSHQGVDARVDRAVFEVKKDVRMGKSLSQAFENQGAIFPPLTVPLIRAGEVSGQLDEMLERLCSHFERELALVRSWRQAAAYPALIFVFCTLLTLGLITHIFPTFINLFKGLEVELPLATRALITITETSRNPVVLLPLLLGMSVGGYFLWVHFRSPVGRRQWDWMRLEAPYLGPLSRKTALSRVARTLGVLLESGIPTLTSLKVAGQASGNSVLKDAIERICFEMERGARFSELLQRSDMFPRVFVQLVEAGEQSGELPAMLLRIGDFFEEDVMLSLAVFTTLLEPVMIGVMGAIVMFVLVAVFQPVYQLMSLF